MICSCNKNIFVLASGELAHSTLCPGDQPVPRENTMLNVIEQSISWAKSEGAILSDEIEIKESALGGWGIFAKSDIDPDTTVLSVPPVLTFDIHSLLDHLSKILEQDQQCGDLIKHILSVLNFPVETLIIRSFMWGFAILMSKGHHKLLKSVEPYLKVLLTTQILDVDETEDCQCDDLIQQQINEKRLVRQHFDDLMEQVPELHPHLSFEDAFVIHQAIKSRTLDIPHALEEDDEEYEYQTQITMVPMLDFANHSSDLNARFDVDKLSETVILQTTNKVESGEEILISYSLSKLANTIFQTYGFLPSNGMYEWLIPFFDVQLNDFKHTENENYTLMGKWLHIEPQVEIGYQDDAALVEPGCRLPYILIPGLSYFNNWRNEVADIEEDGHNVNNLSSLEMHASKIPLETAYGVLWNDAYVSVPNILLQTWEDSEDGLTRLNEMASSFLEQAIQRALDKDTEYRHSHKENSLVSNYFDTKFQILTNLLFLANSGHLHMP